MSDAERKRLLETCVNALMKEFEAVQILVTRQDETGTHMGESGAGNFFARKALAREFAKSDDDKDLARRIAEASSGEGAGA